jgi:predicted transcriptional regulator
MANSGIGFRTRADIGCLTLKPRAKTPPAFKTRRDIERYFGGKTIECLLCRQRFRRLGGHLAAKHEVSVDDYRSRFGLPWTRGLTSAASMASSGWTDKRKATARKLARKSRFRRPASGRGERLTTGMAIEPTTVGAISEKPRTVRWSRTEVSSATTPPALRG